MKALIFLITVVLGLKYLFIYNNILGSFALLILILYIINDFFN